MKHVAKVKVTYTDGQECQCLADLILGDQVIYHGCSHGVMLEKRFKVSYGGETDYEIWDGRRMIGEVSARYQGYSKAGWNVGVWENNILPTIGTIRWRSSGAWHEFPPADVVALFPGYTACRLVFHPRTPHLTIMDRDYQLPDVEYIYDGEPPVLAPHEQCPDYVAFIPVPATSLEEVAI